MFVYLFAVVAFLLVGVVLLYKHARSAADRGYFDLEKADVPSPMPVLMRRPEWKPHLVSGTWLKPANHLP